MGIRKFNQTTPGQRFKELNDYEELTAGKPEKSLLVATNRTGGRNNTGKMTMRYIGGGHRKKLRDVDFKREKHGIKGIVKTIEYDPGRTANIALIHYSDGEKRYIIAPTGLKIGQTINSGATAT